MLSLANLISNTWLLYSKNFVTYLKLSFFIFLVTIPAAAISSLSYAFFASKIANLSLSILINLLVFFLTILVTIVLVRVADKQLKSLSSGESISLSLSREFENSLKLWPMVLVVSIIVGLIQLIGLFFLIVPGIIFSVWFAFALCYVILEFPSSGSVSAAIKESLKQSRELVRGRFWGVLLRIFVPTILWSLFGWAISMIFVNSLNIIQKYFLVGAAESATRLLDILKILGSTYINALFIPLFVITTVILFRSLESTKTEKI
jgi:hypothetical protein